MNLLPTVSIIIVGRNCARFLSACIRPIQEQAYPKELIEILFIDGESSDDTRETAATLGAQVIKGGYPENAEARRYVGAKKAQHDILVFIDVDNIIPHKQWLKDMVRPFIDYADMVGTFTKWYGFDAETSKAEQYYALVGGNDPVAFYLGKNDRVPYLENTLPRGAHLVSDVGGYEVVIFNSSSLPVVGCNGFLLRKSIINQLDYDNYNAYLHIDINVDIINRLQKNLYAIVKTTILHLTGDKILKNIRKRIHYMNVHHVTLKAERRYQVFDVKKSQDVFRLFLCILYAVTFVEPLWRSYRGWRRTGNVNWFYHPFVTFLLTTSYGFNIIRKAIKR